MFSIGCCSGPFKSSIKPASLLPQVRTSLFSCRVSFPKWRVLNRGLSFDSSSKTTALNLLQSIHQDHQQGNYSKALASATTLKENLSLSIRQGCASYSYRGTGKLWDMIQGTFSSQLPSKRLYQDFRNSSTALVQQQRFKEAIAHAEMALDLHPGTGDFDEISLRHRRAICHLKVAGIPHAPREYLLAMQHLGETYKECYPKGSSQAGRDVLLADGSTCQLLNFLHTNPQLCPLQQSLNLAVEIYDRAALLSPGNKIYQQNRIAVYTLHMAVSGRRRTSSAFLQGKLTDYVGIPAEFLKPLELAPAIDKWLNT